MNDRYEHRLQTKIEDENILETLKDQIKDYREEEAQ